MEAEAERWLSKDEVQKLGMSERTLERRAREGHIKRIYRSIPGRKSAPFFFASDVERLLAKPKTPVVLKTAKRRRAARQNAASGLPAKAPPRSYPAIPPSVPIEKKLYLSVTESVLLTGLSDTLLRRLIKAKKLPAIIDGGYKIRRADLENLHALLDGDMTP